MNLSSTYLLSVSVCYCLFYVSGDSRYSLIGLLLSFPNASIIGKCSSFHSFSLRHTYALCLSLSFTFSLRPLRLSLPLPLPVRRMTAMEGSGSNPSPFLGSIGAAPFGAKGLRVGAKKPATAGDHGDTRTHGHTRTHTHRTHTRTHISIHMAVW